MKVHKINYYGTHAGDIHIFRRPWYAPWREVHESWYTTDFENWQSDTRSWTPWMQWFLQRRYQKWLKSGMGHQPPFCCEYDRATYKPTHRMEAM